MEGQVYISACVLFSLLTTLCVAMHSEPIPAASFSPGKLVVSGNNPVSVSSLKNSTCQCDMSDLVSSQITAQQREVEKLKSSLTMEATERQRLEKSLLAEVEARKKLEMSLKNLEISLQRDASARQRKQQIDEMKMMALKQREADNRAKLGLRVTNLEQSLLTETRRGQRKVAFSARVNNVQRSQTIVFAYVITNVGGGYNSTSGKFRCPVSGLYKFFVNILSHAFKENIFSVLKLNGETKMYISLSDDVGSNTVIVQLRKDDLVWVEGRSTNGVACCRSTFTGHLLYSR